MFYSKTLIHDLGLKTRPITTKCKPEDYRFCDILCAASPSFVLTCSCPTSTALCQSSLSEPCPSFPQSGRKFKVPWAHVNGHLGDGNSILVSKKLCTYEKK